MIIWIKCIGEVIHEYYTCANLFDQSSYSCAVTCHKSVLQLSNNIDTIILQGRIQGEIQVGYPVQKLRGAYFLEKLL